MTGKMKILIPTVIIICGGLIMWLFLSLGGDKSKRENKSQTKVVETEIVKLASTPAKILGYGRVASVQPIQLYSEVSGILQAGNIPFQPAQSFHKGDLLLKVDNRQATLALNSTKSDLMTALATFLSEIKSNFPEDFEIWEEYFNSCSFDNSLKELPETENQKIKLFLSRFNVYKLYFAVRDFEIKLSKHYFYAPFDGSIVTANQRAGSTARIGTLLGEIINLEKLEVEVPVSVQNVQWINRETSVKLFSSEISGAWTGQITRIGQTIDPRTQTIQVFISIDNLHQLPILEGVFFQVEILGFNVENAVTIPHKALYNEEFVYLIKNGKLLFQKVEIARKENGSAIISGGLNDGDTLVIEAMQGVYDGMSAITKMNKNEVRTEHE